MKQIIFSLIYLASLLSLSVFVFDPTHLYYELPWLDVPMHVMGGFGVAALFIAYKLYRKRKISFTAMILFYFLIAVGWELYELANDIMNLVQWNGWPDTLSDVVNGAIGSIIAYLIFKK
jgi:hypothetical protein